MSNICCGKPPANARRADAGRVVVLGKIVGVWGVQGWLKIYSYAREKSSIFSYVPWYLGNDPGGGRAYRLITWREQSGSLIARLAGVENRSLAAGLVGHNIYVATDQLPQLAPGEYYWFELEGLPVFNLEGADLGVVDHLLETGANDVLVLRGSRERLIPYTPAVVKRVDIETGRIEVDWDVDWDTES